MHTQGNDKRGDAVPVIVAIIIAVLGVAGILFEDFGLNNNGSQDNGNAKMITAAAVFRAGAIEIPSEGSAGPPGS